MSIKKRLYDCLRLLPGKPKYQIQFCIYYFFLSRCGNLQPGYIFHFTSSIIHQLSSIQNSTILSSSFNLLYPFYISHLTLSINFHPFIIPLFQSSSFNLLYPFSISHLPSSINLHLSVYTRSLLSFRMMRHEASSAHNAACGGLKL